MTEEEHEENETDQRYAEWLIREAQRQRVARRNQRLEFIAAFALGMTLFVLVLIILSARMR